MSLKFIKFKTLELSVGDNKRCAGVEVTFDVGLF